MVIRPLHVAFNYLQQGIRPPEHFLLSNTGLNGQFACHPAVEAIRRVYQVAVSRLWQHKDATGSGAGTCCSMSNHCQRIRCCCLRLSHLHKHAACSCRPGSRLAALQCTHTGQSCEAQPPTTQLLLPDSTATLTTMRGSEESGKACCQAVKKSGLGCMPALRHNT